MSAEYQKLTTVSVAPEGTTAALLGDGGEKVRGGRAYSWGEMVLRAAPPARYEASVPFSEKTCSTSNTLIQ